MKKNLYQWMACFLVLALFFGIIAEAFPKKRVEPNNPIKTEITELKTDIRTRSGSHGQKDIMQQLQSIENREKSSETGTGASGETSKENQEGEEPPKEEMSQTETPPIEEESKETEDTPSQKQKEEEEETSNQETQTSKEEGETQSDESSAGETGDSKDKIQGENGEEGEKNDRVSGKNEEGELPDQGGEEVTDAPGTGEAPGEDEHGLVTDLYDKILLFSELEKDTFNFYAYYSDAEVDADIRVNYRHKEDNSNGIWLEKKGDHDYSAKLSLGQNYITIYYTDGEGVRNWARITITYQADKADIRDPEKGNNPPVIKTNLDDWTEDIRIFEFTFLVDAKKYDGSRIYSNQIQVWLDGVPVTNPTGSGIYEYVLEFGMPLEGNLQHHTVSVLAWDDEGNSRYVEYSIRHKVNDEGIVIGTVKVQIDVTTLGLGIIDEAEVTIASGDTAADAVIKMLEECGYSYRNTGDLRNDFYLASIERADAFRGAEIEERLKRLIERDGITFLPNSGRDKLGEFDYTRGSGWMYFLNGELCPGKAMSGYTLNGGELISLRFTLAFGKDVGGTVSDGNTSLKSYCGKWVNGSILEFTHDYKEAERKEATETEEGYVLYHCDKCKEEKKEVLIYQPPEEGEDPPIEGGEDPPIEGGEDPPIEGGEDPPIEGGENPPIEGGEDPPIEGGEDPPVEGGEDPPAEGGEDPPAEGGEDPPIEGGENPPIEGGEDPPVEGGEDPPEEGGEDPPIEGGEDPPAEESVTENETEE